MTPCHCIPVEPAIVTYSVMTRLLSFHLGPFLRPATSSSYRPDLKPWSATCVRHRVPSIAVRFPTASAMALSAPTSLPLEPHWIRFPVSPSSFPDHFLVFRFFSASPCASVAGGSPIRTWCEPAFPGASFSITCINVLSTLFITKRAKSFCDLCTLHKTLRDYYSTLHSDYKNAVISGI